MCSSPDALGKLTLPDGSSRVGTSHERLGDAQLMSSGGCVPIPTGATVTVITARKNTSIVSYGVGAGARTFILPNIDFTEASTPETGSKATGGETRPPDPDCMALGARWAQQHKLPGPVSNAEQFVTWRAACAGSPPTGPGDVNLLGEADVAKKTGAPVRIFYWQKHAGSVSNTGSIPCSG